MDKFHLHLTEYGEGLLTPVEQPACQGTLLDDGSSIFQFYITLETLSNLDSYLLTAILCLQTSLPLYHHRGHVQPPLSFFLPAASIDAYLKWRHKRSRAHFRRKDPSTHEKDDIFGVGAARTHQLQHCRRRAWGLAIHLRSGFLPLQGEILSVRGV